MPDYGALSKRNLDEQQEGARVAVDAHKKHPGDFVLWKLSSENEPGWESPWGRGRPGWHIECSAMSAAYLGEVFDIHGGGLDLIFPHHENEIAQSRCAHGADRMAQVWMHNGFLQVEGEKMSKSLGNFVTIRELLSTDSFGGRRWSGDVLRLAMLKTHYRQPIDWTVSALDESESNLRRWRRHLRNFNIVKPGSLPDKFLDRLTNDLNTPFAIAIINELSAVAAGSVLGQVIQESERKKAAEKLAACLSLLGISLEEVMHIEVDSSKVKSLIDARLAARKSKDFAESDRIRDELKAMGVVIKDNKDGTTTWEVAR
jgi:cysteinyl-tRNA synthetase